MPKKQKIATTIIRQKLLAQKLVKKVAHYPADDPPGAPSPGLRPMLGEGGFFNPNFNPDGAREAQGWTDLQKVWKDKGLPEASFDWSAQPELARSMARAYAGLPPLKPPTPLPPAVDPNVPSISAAPPPPPPPKYRGEGGYWDFGFHPVTAQHQKTQQQLSEEQGTNQKYLRSDSVFPQLNALGQGVVLGGASHVWNNLAAYPAIATDALGLTRGARQAAREDSIISADRFFRGWHQLTNPTTSRAYDQMFGSGGAIAERMQEQAAEDGPGTPAADAYENYVARQGFADALGPVAGGAVVAAPAAFTSAPVAVGTALNLGPHAIGVADDVRTRADNSNIGTTQEEKQNIIQNDLMPLAFSDDAIEAARKDGLYVTIRGERVPFSSLSPEDAQYMAQAAMILPLFFAENGLQTPTNLQTNAERLSTQGMPQDPNNPAPVVGAQTNASTPSTAPELSEQTPAPETQNTAPETSSRPPVADLLPADAAPEYIDLAASEQQRIGADQEARELITNPTSEKAKQKGTEAQPTFMYQGASDYAVTNPPPTTPLEKGEWFKDMLDDLNNSWNQMGAEGQLAFALGVPLGLIGMLSGNIGGFLLGAIGLGVGGMAAAQSGMFGDEAKGYADAGMNTVMQATGLDQMFGQSAAGAQPQSENSAAGTVPPAQQPFEYTPDSARKVLTDISAAWPHSLRATVKNNETALLEIAKQNDDELAGVVAGLNPKTRTDLVTNLNRIYNNVTDDPNTPVNEPEVVKPQVQRLLRLIESESMKKSSVNYVKETLIPKIARCWKGYEPVPGAKAYTEGSCRPKGSKKTQKQMKKKSSWSAVDIVNNYMNSPQINSRQPWQIGLSAKH